jgi:hypothetical protein
MSGALATEADIVRTLSAGVYTLDELYRLCAQRADIARERGLEPTDAAHLSDRVWRRRVRGVLQALRATGNAERVGRSTWALRGSRERPELLVLIVGGRTVADFELRLQDAITLLEELEEPADLVLCDPPYALGRLTVGGRIERSYRRAHNQVIPGYVDVAAEHYEQFTHAWVGAAAAALRPAGQLAVITGPQQAALVQRAAELSDLTWVSSIAAFRHFALRTTRRPACSHWTITVMCRGRVENPRRVFNTPPDLPKARSGGDYPLDWWPENGRAHRHGLMRYDNSLPEPLVGRVITAFSDPGELVVDPCLGAGTSAICARRLGRRFVGGDVNPHALRFSAARLLAEHAWPEERQPSLFAA